MRLLSLLGVLILVSGLPGAGRPCHDVSEENIEDFYSIFWQMVATDVSPFDVISANYGRSGGEAIHNIGLPQFFAAADLAAIFRACSSLTSDHRAAIEETLAQLLDLEIGSDEAMRRARELLPRECRQETEQ